MATDDFYGRDEVWSHATMLWGITEAPLSASTKMTLLALLSFASKGDWECWPSFKTLAAKAGMSRRSVITHVKALEELGLICRRQKYSGEGQTSNVYTLAPDAIADLEWADIPDGMSWARCAEEMDRDVLVPLRQKRRERWSGSKAKRPSAVKRPSVEKSYQDDLETPTFRAKRPSAVKRPSVEKSYQDDFPTFRRPGFHKVHLD